MKASVALRPRSFGEYGSRIRRRRTRTEAGRKARPQHTISADRIAEAFIATEHPVNRFGRRLAYDNGGDHPDTVLYRRIGSAWQDYLGTLTGQARGGTRDLESRQYHGFFRYLGNNWKKYKIPKVHTKLAYEHLLRSNAKPDTVPVHPGLLGIGAMGAMGVDLARRRLRGDDQDIEGQDIEDQDIEEDEDLPSDDAMSLYEQLMRKERE